MIQFPLNGNALESAVSAESSKTGRESKKLKIYRDVEVFIVSRVEHK